MNTADDFPNYVGGDVRANWPLRDSDGVNIGRVAIKVVNGKAIVVAKLNDDAAAFYAADD